MKNLQRITILYLAFPFIIFCMGWLRLSIAIPVMALILWSLWCFLKQTPNSQLLISNSQSPYSAFNIHFYSAILLTCLWVFLSGVGGYTFQNWDHHWRNAVLHDLIKYDWPVIYSAPERGPLTMLIYYVGYWLPSAWVGKVFGWQAANFILFLWTWLGVFLAVLHLNIKLKASPLKIALLLIFFSGMDLLGALLFAQDYPTLWPPITHLEIWSGSLQYSSFTTQLFWVFNQAVPAWLCIALLINDLKREQSAFVWSLCFFFAPLASIGLIPYLLIDLFKQTDFKTPLKNLRPDLLLASGMIFLFSFFFFSANTAAQSRGFQSIALKDFLAFFLLEGGFLWLLLAPLKWRDPYWIVTGLLLLIIPFIQFGSGRDFVMRVSIAPLFYLMLMTGETLFQKSAPRYVLYTIYFLLLLGSFTPLYEINRSAYRTFAYYFLLDDRQISQSTFEPVTHLDQPGVPEKEHPNTLAADEIKTLKFMTDKLSKNFIANVRQSLYYRYLSAR